MIHVILQKGHQRPVAPSAAGLPMDQPGTRFDVEGKRNFWEELEGIFSFKQLKIFRSHFGSSSVKDLPIVSYPRLAHHACLASILWRRTAKAFHLSLESFLFYSRCSVMVGRGHVQVPHGRLGDVVGSDCCSRLSCDCSKCLVISIFADCGTHRPHYGRVVLFVCCLGADYICTHVVRRSVDNYDDHAVQVRHCQGFWFLTGIV